MTPEETAKIKSLKDRSEIFNYVVDHLRLQGKRSIFINNFEGDETCAYRGDGGTMCAAGVLIADDEYSPSFEGKSIYTLVRQNLLTPDLKKRIEPNEPMISDLQSLHDHHLTYKNGEFTVATKNFIDKLREKWGIEQ
jgi:hypothetical protein